MIETRELSHTYSPGSLFEAAAIDSVSLTIPDGVFAAIIGATGSGKTTLIQHLNGLIKPTGGQVLVDGEDINAPGADKRALRRKVGMVFQYPEHQLFDETVAKDVAFGPRNLGLSDAECQERVREAMARVGLDYDTFGGRSPFELSGGQMRRAALAGVLAMRPTTLVLDEPAAGMDPRGRRELFALLEDLHVGGATIVLVSHSMEDVAGLARLVFVLANGRLLMQGAPRDVFSRSGELRSIGLDIPDVARLRDTLVSRGMGIPRDIFTGEAMRRALLQIWDERKPSAVNGGGAA